MKQKLIYWAAMLLLLAACDKKKEEPESPPQNAKYTLYDKPLEEIQAAIKGKWKVYASYGGVVGKQYPKEVYVTFYEDKHVLENYDETFFQTFYYTWEKKKINNWTTPSLNGLETYVMCDKETGAEENYFVELKNDTLSVNSYSAPLSTLYVKCEDK